jgi:hypothetical protein
MTAAARHPRVARLRLRQLPVLGGPLAAAVRWQPLAGTAALSGLVLAWQADDLDDAGTSLMVLRAVAALLAVGAAFLLDDAAVDTLAASPTSLAWRRGHRLLVLAVLGGVPWALAVGAVAWRGGEPPVAGLTLELAAMLALAVAASSLIARRACAPEPGVLAVPVIVGLVLASARLPERWALFVPPGPSWGPAHLRWSVLLLAAVLAVLACTRDLASRRRRRGV